MHKKIIALLRMHAAAYNDRMDQTNLLVLGTVADLLEMHDRTGISLDNWNNARDLCEVVVREVLPDYVDADWKVKENNV